MLKIKYRKNDNYAIIPFVIKIKASENGVYGEDVILNCMNEAIEKYFKNKFKDNQEVTADIVEKNFDLKEKTGYVCVAYFL